MNTSVKIIRRRNIKVTRLSWLEWAFYHAGHVHHNRSLPNSQHTAWALPRKAKTSSTFISWMAVKMEAFFWTGHITYKLCPKLCPKQSSLARGAVLELHRQQGGYNLFQNTCNTAQHPLDVPGVAISRYGFQHLTSSCLVPASHKLSSSQLHVAEIFTLCHGRCYVRTGTCTSQFRN